MTTPVIQMARASLAADLRDELNAAGQDMVAMASRLELAYTNDRLDLIPSIIDRLRRLGAMYRDCMAPGAGAA